MKKYVKPEAFFESYQLSQQIAACRWDMNQADGSTCSATYDKEMNNIPSMDVRLFSNTSICNITEDEAAGNPLLQYCYTNGTVAEAKLFNS